MGGGPEKKKAGGNPTSPEGEERTNPMVETSEAASAADVNGDISIPPLGPGNEAAMAFMDSKSHNSDAGSTVTITSTHGATRVQKWIELLENKPDPENKEAMAAWMLSLMNATEGAPAAATAVASVDSQVEVPSAVDVVAAEIDHVEGLVPTDEVVTAASASPKNEDEDKHQKVEREEGEDEDDTPPNTKKKFALV